MRRGGAYVRAGEAFRRVAVAGADRGLDAPEDDSANSALRTPFISLRASRFTPGNLRSSCSSVLMIVAATTSCVNHLWSAGTTCHGECGVEVWRTISSWVVM